jgi:hypothetical protein
MKIHKGDIIRYDSKEYPGSWVVWEYQDKNNGKCVETHHPNWVIGQRAPNETSLNGSTGEFTLINRKSLGFNDLYLKLSS